MPNTKPPSGTGTAPIVKVGHTATSKFGTDPDVKQTSQDTPRELNAK